MLTQHCIWNNLGSLKCKVYAYMVNNNNNHKRNLELRNIILGDLGGRIGNESHDTMRTK